MSQQKQYDAVPVRIGVYYLAWLAAASILGFQLVGAEAILTYASEIKPYSGVLSERYFRSLSDSSSSGKVIYFGDSNSFHPPDVSARSGDSNIHMPGLIRQAISTQAMKPKLTFCEISFLGAAMFEFYCLFYTVGELSPDLIVVPINWRSFGSGWINDSRWFHPELSALVPISEGISSTPDNPLRSRGISAIRHLGYKIQFHYLYPIGIKAWALENVRSWFDPHAQDTIPRELSEEEDVTIGSPPGPEEGDNAAMRTEAIVSNSVKTDKFAATAKKLRTMFPMKISSSNPRLISLFALANVASERGIKTLFYIWPLDQEYLAEVGILDRSALERSKLLITEATKKENVTFLDLSDLLQHRYFNDYQGHCTVEGRRKIAEALAPRILEILEESSSPKE